MKIYVGYDTCQQQAFDVCKYSIERHSSIEIIPVVKQQLEADKIYWGDKKGSTDFSFTRFLVPYLNNYSDFAIFCDSDFLWNCDPMELKEYVNTTKAVFVVKHQIQDSEMPVIKMNNKSQFWYPKKNWSSLMVFNCSHSACRTLTPDVVSNMSGKYLHEFEWVGQDQIGDLPRTYNYLVGYYNDNKDPKAIHFTTGGPWHENYKDVQFSKLWEYYKECLMKNSTKSLH